MHGHQSPARHAGRRYIYDQTIAPSSCGSAIQRPDRALAVRGGAAAASGRGARPQSNHAHQEPSASGTGRAGLQQPGVKISAFGCSICTDAGQRAVERVSPLGGGTAERGEGARATPVERAARGAPGRRSAPGEELKARILVPIGVYTREGNPIMKHRASLSRFVRTSFALGALLALGCARPAAPAEPDSKSGARRIRRPSDSRTPRP